MGLGGVSAAYHTLMFMIRAARSWAAPSCFLSSLSISRYQPSSLTAPPTL
jgi:hypothetical protein